MNHDYFYIVIIFFAFLCFAHYMRRRDLRKMFEESETKSNNRSVQLKLIDGGLSKAPENPTIKKDDNGKEIINEFRAHN